MRTRQEIKMLAKEAVARQWGTSALIFLLFTLIEVACSSFPLIGLAGGLVYLVLKVGVNGAFISIFCGEKVSVGDPFSCLSVNFWRKLGGMLWVSLWTFIWFLPLFVLAAIALVWVGQWMFLCSLLLIVPAVIAAISYSMTPFILADCPDVKATKAIKLSVRMTYGHKGELFVLVLSFIGWYLLSALTLNILFIVYVGPYTTATYAGFYMELRDLALRSGVIGP